LDFQGVEWLAYFQGFSAFKLKAEKSHFTIKIGKKYVIIAFFAVLPGW